MNVEHVAFLVEDPNAVADWYCKNLGMKVMRKGGPPTHMTFLADEDEKTMFEIYTNPEVKTPDYASQHPLILHLAFYAEDVKAMREKLMAAGATPVDEITVTDAGDTLAMMRDPWGLALQVLCRKNPMI